MAADFGAPIAQTVNPVGQGMQALSDVMSLKQKKQALQTGVYQQQTAQANAQQDQQKNEELQSLAQFTRSAAQDPKYHNPDGSLNVQKYQTDAMAAAPTYGQAYIGQMTSNANAMVENRKALLGLSNEQRKTIGSYFGAVAANPKATGQDFMDAAEQARGVSDDPAYQRAVDRMLMSGPQIAMLPTDQASAAIRNHAMNIATQTNATNQDIGGTTSVQMVQGKQGMVPINVNPRYAGGVGPVGPAQQQGLSPEARAESVDLGNGQRAILNRATGRYDLVQPTIGNQSQATARATINPPSGTQPFGRDAQGRVLTAADTAPPANAPRADQENYRVAAAAARDHVSTVRDQDQGYGNNMAVASEIRRLSASTTTGPGTTAFNQWAGTLGTRVGVDISDYQKLGAFLDRQSADLRKQMGLPGTNAGQETAAAISGNTEYQRKAIQAKNDYNEALTQGLHDYRQGLDRVESFTGDANPREVQRYRAAWTSNFDPRAYEYKLAKQRGDADAANSFLANLSPQQAKATAQKLRSLDKLTQGQAP